MGMKPRIAAGILTTAIVISSLQYPIGIVKAEELPQGNVDITDEAGDIATGIENENTSKEIQDAEENNMQSTENKSPACDEEYTDSQEKNEDEPEIPNTEECDKENQKAGSNDDQEGDDTVKITDGLETDEILTDTKTSGTWGDNITWTLENGILTISGSGAIKDGKRNDNTPPWRNNKNITNIIVLFGITHIGDFAFIGCSSLTSIEIPSSVTSIGDSAFYNCSSLTCIDIPSDVINIGPFAFSGCSSLTSIEIPSSVTRIEGNTFSSCSSLANIEIPSSVTYIGAQAFAYCHALTNIEIPSSVTFIADQAFNGSGLTSIEIPFSITAIAESTFIYCRSLTSIKIPSSITSIGLKAFHLCDNLKDIYYAGSKDDWESISIDDGNSRLFKSTIHYNSSGTGSSEDDSGDKPDKPPVLPSNPEVTDTSITEHTVDFYSWFTNGTACPLSIEWGWDLFKGTPSSPDPRLVMAGITLSAATESSQANAEAVMKEFSFSDHKPSSINYDGSPLTQIEKPGMTFGYKKIINANGNKHHVFAVAIRGTTDIEDLITDVNSIVNGFSRAAEYTYLQLESYMLQCGLTPEDIFALTGGTSEDKITFFVTGHSLGGAVANITAHNLNRYYGSENVFAYTFAAPPCITWSEYVADSNIYNILNGEDIVPLLYTSMSKRYGNDYSFSRYSASWMYDNFKALTNGKDLAAVMTNIWLWTFIEKIKYAHSVDTYASFYIGVDNANYAHILTRRMGILCPVDVEVYASDDEHEEILVGRVVNNVVDKTVTKGVYINVENDEKYVYLPFEGNYSIRLTGTDKGMMTYFVQDMDTATGEIVSEKIFENVILKNGKQMTSSVCVWNEHDGTGEEIDIPQVKLLILNEDGKADKEVLADGKGTEIPINTESDPSGKPEDTPPAKGDVLPEDMPEDGKIPDGLWIAAISDTVYTGKAIKPVAHVYDSDVRLKAGTDYTVIYKNNVKVSGTSNATTAPTITVTGKGNYSGKDTITFKILPIELTESNMTVADMTRAYNQQIQQPIPSITVNGRKLKNKTDFFVSYPDSTTSGAYRDIGTYRIAVTGTGNYTGEQTLTFDITDKLLISKASVSKISNQIYTGNAVRPAAVVKYQKISLVEHKDYELEYQNNVDIGKATVVIKGIGDYAGKKTVSFQITGGSIKKAKVTGLVSPITYTGEELLQNCSLSMLVNDVDIPLKEGKDYTITYKNNVKAGTAKVIFTGINGYTGTLQKSYKITPYDILSNNSSYIEYTKDIVCTYLKGGSRPEPDLYFKGTLLKKGVDYTLSYRNNNAVSGEQMPTIVVNGKGSFKNKIKIPFTIEPQNLSNMTLASCDKVYKDKADIYKITPKLLDINGIALSVGKDFDKNSITYAYENDVILKDETSRKAGDKIEDTDIIPANTRIRVTLSCGSGNLYEGTFTGTYRIVAADIKSAKVSIPAQTYTGSEITPDKTQIRVMLSQMDLSPEDYDIVSYANNIKKGKASVTIIGKGNYGGTKTAKFTIKAKGFLWWWR